MASTRQAFEGVRAELEKQVDADVEAFGAISAAYSLPRATDEEKAARKEAIRRASAGAMEPPLAIARLCGKLAEALPRLAEIGNRNLVTDTGVAALLCEAAFRAAVLNVHVNIKSLGDEDRATEVARELAESGDAVRTACATALSRVEEALQ
jgi:formiminotetrahydrofolate cyclodeaminase